MQEVYNLAILVISGVTTRYLPGSRCRNRIVHGNRIYRHNTCTHNSDALDVGRLGVARLQRKQAMWVESEAGQSA
jgi:hypothetical protein